MQHETRQHRIKAGVGERFIAMDGFDGTSAALTDLKTVAQLLPTGGTHVVLLENVDAATAPALQGLLKILEDPPSSSAFLLTSARPERLPRTLVSRCVIFALLPLDSTTARNVLVDLGVPRSRLESMRVAAQGLPARLIAFANDPEAVVTQTTDARAVLRLFTLPLSQALSEVPNQGLNPEIAARVLSDLVLRSFGLPTAVIPEQYPAPNFPPHTIANAAYELLADTAAGRYTPKAIAERVMLRLHRP
jgi:hypothetical protein